MAKATNPDDSRLAERASQESLQRQSALLADDALMTSVADSAQTYIAILNPQRQVVFTNRTLLDAFSSDAEHAMGKRIGDLFGCQNANKKPAGCGTTLFCTACGAAEAIRVSQTGGAEEEECRIIRENGDPIELRVSATPFEIEGEDFTLFTGADIGDTKRRETLERIFFHDIMNTATAMRGLSAMAKTASPEDKDEMLELLETTSDHLIDEISAQRELLAAEVDELVARPQPVNSRQLLVDVAGVYSSHDVGAGKVITIDAASDQVTFVTDPALLGRVIGNLVKNALEASPTGHLVSLACTKQGPRVGFSVHNDGHIPHRSQLQIFQRSFTTKGGGRGLGTYGARLLTERYLGGDIAFESTKDEGTTFTVSYPYAPVDADSVGRDDLAGQSPR